MRSLRTPLPLALVFALPLAAQQPRATAGTAVVAPNAMIASNSEYATAAGIEVLHAGGNAVDAAVATGFALAVTHPEAGNIGGGGYMVIRMADGRVAALDYRELAPKAATREMFMDSASRADHASEIGPRAIGVPGSVLGMITAKQEFGSKLPLSKVLAPAIRLAEKGFIVDSALARSLANNQRRIGRFAGASVFLPHGKPLVAGQKLVQPALAQTLRAIAQHGAKGFYAGPVAAAIAAEQQKDGGLITLEDLKGYHVAWRDPLRGTYHGYTLLTMPPSSSGGITVIETLNMLENFAPLAPARSTMETHLLAESLRRAFIDRNALLGDPEFSPQPIALLTSKAYGRTLASTISRDAATPTVDAERRTPAGEARSNEGVNTTHYSVVDSKGNAVATTTTLNDLYGSGVYIAAGGFFLNDEMDDFTTNPGQPNGFGLVQGEKNTIAPGKRMLSAMAPTIVLDTAGKVLLVLGARGGPRIITSVAQVILGVIEFNESLADAVFAGRVHMQARPDTLKYESGALDSAVVDSLGAMGYAMAIAKFGEDPYIGRVIAIGRVSAGWVGVVDRRTSGGAAGY